MNEKAYNLIERVKLEKTRIKELYRMLKTIERNLRKGNGAFEIPVKFDENKTHIAEMGGFAIKSTGFYQYIFSGEVKTAYNFSVLKGENPETR